MYQALLVYIRCNIIVFAFNVYLHVVGIMHILCSAWVILKTQIVIYKYIIHNYFNSKYVHLHVTTYLYLFIITHPYRRVEHNNNQFGFNVLISESVSVFFFFLLQSMLLLTRDLMLYVRYHGNSKIKRF